MSESSTDSRATESNEPREAEELLPLVYSELRRIAQQKMRAQAPGQTLQATALVHEAYLKLATPDNRRWKSRRHFLAYSAEAMRGILIDQARRKQSEKRGGGIPAEELCESRIEAPRPVDQLLQVHDALDHLAKDDPDGAELVKLRYFAGLSMQEAADAMELPLRSAERLWTYARARLKRAINEDF